jgi:hypothetical protein
VTSRPAACASREFPVPDGGMVGRRYHGQPVTVPERYQRSRKAGDHLPPDTTCVDRSTFRGNPFSLNVTAGILTRADAEARFRVWLLRENPDGPDVLYVGPKAFDRRRIWEGMGELRGRNVACFCPAPGPCHGNVYIELANQPEMSTDA